MNRVQGIFPRTAGLTHRMRLRRARPVRTVLRPTPAGLRRGDHGFTLIEITIVLLLIGVLSALAVTTYRMMVNKARITQAKTVLSHLTKTEATYFSDHDRYTDNIVLLNFDPARYNYYEISVVIDNDAMNYTGIATGVGVMAGDRWYVTKDRDPFQDNTSPFK